MLAPLSGALEHIAFDRSCNFHLSHLQIWVEMAFSLLSAKWRPSRRSLDAKGPECVSSLCRAAAKLHNCIVENDRSTASPGKATFCRADFGVKNLPNHDKGCLNAIPTSATQGVVGKDQRRASILTGVEAMQLQHPIHDILRNCNEEPDNSVVDDSWTVNHHLQCFQELI